MKKNTFIPIALSLTLLSLGWMLLTPIFLPSEAVDAKTIAAHRGFIAPGFTLQTPQGDSVSLADFSGTPTLVFFWASWCSICKATLPDLQAVYEDYSPLGFEILAINSTHQDTLSTAIAYFENEGYSFAMLLDRDGITTRDYQVYALPTSVMVAPDGTVLNVIIGAGMREGVLRAQLNDIFAVGE